MVTSLRHSGVVLVNNHRDTFSPVTSGAIATCIWELCQAASNDDVIIHVITPTQESSLYDWPLVHQTPPMQRLPASAERVFRRGTGWASWAQYTYARAAAAIVDQIAPGLVICNNDPQVAVGLTRRSSAPDVVHWFHNLEVVPDRWRRAFVRSSVRPVAVSRYLSRAVESIYGLGALEVATAHNGVDSKRFRPVQGVERPIPVIGFLGRVAVEKGPDILLRACLQLARSRQDFSLRLIGDTNWGWSDGGPYGRLIDTLVTELTAAGIMVECTGHIERADVPTMAASLDLMVLPSRWDEPCALTVSESLAMGLAVITTSTGGTPETVRDAAVIVPREDPELLARAIERLLDEPRRRAELQVQARARAIQLTWRRTWDALTSTDIAARR